LLPATANQVLEESGARTAAYVIRNRIPAPIRTLLRILPPRPAARLLLAAIARHSWTFAGAAAFSYQLRPTPTVRLAGNPATGAMPGVAVDPYYHGAFSAFMRDLVSPRAQVGAGVDAAGAHVFTVSW
jgi:divinyl protochlorophyllide a 8-vinyl-reductase